MPNGSGQFREARFCPSCGVASIQRDDYGKQAPPNSHLHHRVEFICSACGFGFRLEPSLRWQHALALFREHRQMRPPADHRDGKGV